MLHDHLLKEHIDTDFFIRHNISTSWNMSQFHFHDVFEIYYAMSDGVKYFVDDKVYEVKKGDLFVFNNMDLHKTIAPADTIYERYIITFRHEFIENLSTPQTDLLECFLNREPDFVHRIHLNFEQSSNLLEMFKKAEKYTAPDVYGADIYKKLVLTEILIVINSYYHSSRSNTVRGREGTYNRIKPVIDYIHEHLDSDLSLEKLSTRFFLSKYHLGFLFKSATGFSINEYVINRRIIKARELLKKNLPVAQVCEMVGFNNQCHFTRTFKKLVGSSPKQYALKG